jgi:mitogen-activated protein kinase organizer 1
MTDTSPRHLNSHNESVNTVKLTYDGNYCMTGSNDRTVKLWNPHKNDLVNPQNGFLIQTYSGNHGYGVNDIAIMKDNSKFISAGGDKCEFPCFMLFSL